MNRRFVPSEFSSLAHRNPSDELFEGFSQPVAPAAEDTRTWTYQEDPAESGPSTALIVGGVVVALVGVAALVTIFRG